MQFQLFNIIEGWRVETLLGKHFPGCRKNLRFYHHVSFWKEKTKGGSNAPVFFVLEYILLTVMSWDSSEVEKNRTLSRKEMVTACSGIEKRTEMPVSKPSMRTHGRHRMRLPTRCYSNPSSKNGYRNNHKEAHLQQKIRMIQRLHKASFQEEKRNYETILRICSPKRWGRF